MLSKWVGSWWTTGRVTSSPRLSSYLRCLSRSWNQPGPAFLYRSGNKLCIGATVGVRIERARSATSGTRAVGSPPLGYVNWVIGRFISKNGRPAAKSCNYYHNDTWTKFWTSLLFFNMHSAQGLGSLNSEFQTKTYPSYRSLQNRPFGHRLHETAVCTKINMFLHGQRSLLSRNLTIWTAKINHIVDVEQKTLWSSVLWLAAKCTSSS